MIKKFFYTNSYLVSIIFVHLFFLLYFQLKAFLKGRLLEKDVENSIETVAESETNVLAMQAAVDEVLKLINNPTSQHFFNITHSPR